MATSRRFFLQRVGALTVATAMTPQLTVHKGRPLIVEGEVHAGDGMAPPQVVGPSSDLVLATAIPFTKMLSFNANRVLLDGRWARIEREMLPGGQYAATIKLEERLPDNYEPMALRCGFVDAHGHQCDHEHPTRSLWGSR